LKSTGLPLGILPDGAMDAGPPIQLDVGDVLLLVSDGIFECDLPEGGELGIERVIQAARQHLDGPAASLLKALEHLTECVRPDGWFRDDRTAVAAKRIG